jgi:hypothetical protein
MTKIKRKPAIKTLHRVMKDKRRKLETRVAAARLLLPKIQTKETVDHPPHYGGKDNPYEAIKVIEAWRLGFCLGNVLKYISRVDRKVAALEDLKKAAWYLNREIERREKDD